MSYISENISNINWAIVMLKAMYLKSFNRGIYKRKTIKC